MMRSRTVEPSSMSGKVVFWVVSLVLLVLGGIGCDSGSESGSNEPSEVGAQNDNALYVGRWVREHKAGQDVYIFEDTGRFVKQSFETGASSPSTCSQGLYWADSGRLTFYARGGTGGWSIQEHASVVVGDLFTFNQVYTLESTDNGSQVWTSTETVHQFLPEIAQSNPCEQGDGPFTPLELCCPEAVSGLSVPNNTLEWDLKNQTLGTLTLNEDGSSVYTWQKTDEYGNVLVDLEAGSSEEEAAGTWFEDADGVFVSDESSARHFIRLSETTLYEQNPSWLYNRQ